MPINRNCFFLKKFLNSHSGFDREELQNYLNLFAFIMNEISMRGLRRYWNGHCIAQKPSITGINSANKALNR